MAITIAVETRRLATITVDTDDLEEAYDLAPGMIQDDHPNVSWNEAVVDSMTFISQTEDGGYADQAYQRMRDSALMM